MSFCEYQLVAFPSLHSPNSAILEMLALVTMRGLEAMVRLPCGKISADVCFRVRYAVVVSIQVRHGIFLGIFKKLRGRASGRSVLRQVFEPGVVSVGGGRVHSYRDFVSGGSVGTDSDDVSSCYENWLIQSIAPAIDASSILLTCARVTERWLLVPLSRGLDMQPMWFDVLAQMY